MLKINTSFKKYRIPLILTPAVCLSTTLFSYLTFIPTQTFAADDERLIIDSDEHRTLSNITYMQDMSQQICINSAEEETKQLIDSRDSKSYWVTKLKDGNCWMTQNLDYDGGGVKIGSVHEWTLQTVKDGTSAYYDAGMYVYTTPTKQDTCPHNSAGLSACAGYGWVNVDSLADGMYDSHYLVGYYYSWMAATNGTGDGLSSGEDAKGSICARGWQLPSSGMNNTAQGSFWNLFSSYGAAINASGIINSLSIDNYDVRTNPFYYTYNSWLYLGELQYAGEWGMYPSSTVWTDNVSSLGAYNLAITNRINVRNTGMRFLTGLPVRCLALGGWLPVSPDEKKANLSITVSPVISIDATSGMSGEVDFTTVAHGDITATISSNQKYQVLLSTNQSTLEQSPIVPNHNIPMITTDTTITPGTRAWGIKKTNSALAGGTLGDTTANTLFSPIGIGNNKVLFYESLGAESKTITFPVAISVDSTLPSGTYATEVIITATAN